MSALCPDTVSQNLGRGRGGIFQPLLITFLSLTLGSGTSVSLFLGKWPAWADTDELSGMPVLRNFENL